MLARQIGSLVPDRLLALINIKPLTLYRSNNLVVGPVWKLAFLESECSQISILPG